jgi:hypothetical protein
MTDTVVTTPFPVFAPGVKNRLIDQGAGTRPAWTMVDLVASGPMACPVFIYGYDPSLRLHEHGEKAIDDSAPAGSAADEGHGYYVGNIRSLTAHYTNKCLEIAQKKAVSACPETFKTRTVGKLECAHHNWVRYEQLAVVARAVSALVQRMRAEASDEISRPICVPKRHFGVLYSSASRDAHYAFLGACDRGLQESPKAEAAVESVWPVADDIYGPVEHWWTPGRARVLQALKEYSEATHADR